MAGTAVLGVCGLVILLFAARALGAADYAVFGLFWSALFFAVAVLSGVHQETTRAAASAGVGSGERGTPLIRFALVMALSAGVLIAATSPWWVRPTLGAEHGELAVVVALGATGYTLTAVMCGVLAASGRWGAFSVLSMTEGLGRLAAVAIVLALALGTTPLAWAVISVYPLMLAIGAWSVLRRPGVTTRVPDSMGRLLSNTLHTVTAATAIAALVNGFPLLMATFAGDASQETVGAMTLAVMLTRAPLLVPLVGAQGLLITMFASPGRSPWPLISKLLVGVAVVGVVLASLAGTLGPWVLRTAIGENFSLPGHVLAMLVVSSAALGALSLSSPALLAANQHVAYVIGWVVATALAVFLLWVLPLSLELRAPLALLIGPLVGLAWHLGALARHSTKDRRSDSHHYARGETAA
ncbi:lipopolysaccharide biosynthesis protein [Aeromicrobium fastidiosum]|uniref:Polysaccharide biosynthesis protein n=2 Tax=Aeromicrobium fastidiosum TaxID=52699 RepID=A0A641ATW2_9ACTN|nr:hypothetical protein [Aeromicrobium fastidiosum]KAA1380673.1 hypothetical protein ESP62_005750 [Aeromicrobium fastidiosum]MBP2390283.1 O-antigen/teichoic acid export membrane protein [Aeromicrobium fastidiosum]